MPGKRSLAQLVAAIQSGLLVVLILLLAGPMPVPNLFGLGVSLSWTIVCLAVSTVICAPAILASDWPRTPLDWFIAVYLVIVALTTLGSVDRFSTMRAATMLLAEIAVFYATIVAVRRTPRLAPIAVALIIVASGLVELMALGYHIEFGWLLRPKEYPVPAGWAGYPELGALAILQFGLLVGLFQAGRRPMEVASAAGLVLVAVAEILFLGSRSTWAAAAVVLVAGLVFSGRRYRRMLWGLAVVAGLAAGSAVVSPTLRSLAANLLPGDWFVPASGPTIDLAAPGTRLQLWRETTDMIADSPVHGVGLGNFRPVFEADYNPQLNSDDRRGVHAHNLWLQQAAELGVPGGVAFLALWAAGLWTARRAAQRGQDPLAVGLLLALLGSTASNFTDNVPSLMAGVRVYFLTWMMFGLAVAYAAGDRPKPAA